MYFWEFRKEFAKMIRTDGFSKLIGNRRGGNLDEFQPREALEYTGEVKTSVIGENSPLSSWQEISIIKSDQSDFLVKRVVLEIF